MDARIDVFKAFGLSPGDAHVIRNAGGSARDSIRSLVISQQMLGTNAIYLVKHTSKLGGLQISFSIVPVPGAVIGFVYMNIAPASFQDRVVQAMGILKR